MRTLLEATRLLMGFPDQPKWQGHEDHTPKTYTTDWLTTTATVWQTAPRVWHYRVWYKKGLVPVGAGKKLTKVGAMKKATLVMCGANS